MRKLVIQGKATDEGSTGVCVLYSPENGRVIHVHGVTVRPGAELVSEEEMESRARRHAAGFGRTVEGQCRLGLAVQGGPMDASMVSLHACGDGSVRVPTPLYLPKG